MKGVEDAKILEACESAQVRIDTINGGPRRQISLHVSFHVDARFDDVPDRHVVHVKFSLSH